MKNKRQLLIPILLVAISGLSACANESAKQVNLNLRYVTADSVPAKTSNARVEAQLADSSASVDQSLQELSAINVATHPGVKIQEPIRTTDGLSRQASLNWYGPVAPAVKQIADAAHYRLRVLGNEPAVPVIVVINASKQPLSTILRNVTFQAATAVTIKVYPSTKTIELRYHAS